MPPKFGSLNHASLTASSALMGLEPSSQDLHGRFSQWCDAQGLAAWAQLTLIKNLRQRGFEDGKSNGKRGLKGLKLT